MLWRDKSTQIKEHLSWEASTNIKKRIFFFDLFTLVYIRLHSSSDSSTLVYIRLHPSTLVYTCLVTRLCF